VTIEHQVTEHHELLLASADPFGVSFKTSVDKSVAMRVERITFTTWPGQDRPGYMGCHLHGRLLRKTGGHGREMSKYVGVRYDNELWAQVPEDIKTVMREHGFRDGASQ
jgi:hypothetical protein